MRILVMADTHDRLSPSLVTLAGDADEIWHLGDVCAPAVLEAVEGFGPPVTVVHGNCDNTPAWPLVVDLERHGLRFRLVHIPPALPPDRIDVLLHGHTHVPRDELRSGVRFLNAGCVTRPNRGAPASVARLDIRDDSTIAWELIPLR